MDDLKPQEGIIGYFDILGYAKFMENNDVNTVAANVVETLTNLKKQVPETIYNYFKNWKINDTSLKMIKELAEGINWLIFSDTILLTSNYSVDEGKKLEEKQFIKLMQWAIFVCTSSFLVRHMFEFGLPVRGVITKGKFIMKDSCYTGKPLIDAYNLANILDLSVCVITNIAYEEVENLVQFIKKIDVVLSRILQNAFEYYLVPKKNEESPEKLFTLNFFCYLGVWKFYEFSKTDVKQMILDAFSKHNKSVTEREQNKVTNTEKHFLFLINRLCEVIGINSSILLSQAR